jgi:outer membrane immunogenic protein
MDFGADDAVTGASGLTRVDPRFTFDVGGRVGYIVADKTLLYARGGYKSVQATVRRYDLARPAGSHETFDGYSVGGGVERLVTQHVSARLEYRYSDVGNDGGGYEQHQVLGGIAYRF